MQALKCYSIQFQNYFLHYVTSLKILIPICCMQQFETTFFPIYQKVVTTFMINFNKHLYMNTQICEHMMVKINHSNYDDVRFSISSEMWVSLVLYYNSI
jgi:hypothetical protein